MLDSYVACMWVNLSFKSYTIKPFQVKSKRFRHKMKGRVHREAKEEQARLRERSMKGDEKCCGASVS